MSFCLSVLSEILLLLLLLAELEQRTGNEQQTGDVLEFLFLCCPMCPDMSRDPNASDGEVVEVPVPEPSHPVWEPSRGRSFIRIQRPAKCGRP